VDIYTGETLLLGARLMARPDENARTTAPMLKQIFLVVIKSDLGDWELDKVFC
jgi:hypothetical protein